MKKLIPIFALLTLTTVTSATERGAYPQHFSLEVDHTYLCKTKSHNKDLVAMVNTQPKSDTFSKGPIVISTHDLMKRMHFKSGLTANLKIFPTHDFTWEMQYTSKIRWKGEKVVHGLDTLILDTTRLNMDSDYTQASRAYARNTSTMYNAELNCWHAITPRYTDYFSVSWVMGARYFNVQEGLKLSLTKTTDQASTSNYSVYTKNQLLNVQLGGMFECNPYSFLTWGCTAKLGGGPNFTYIERVKHDHNNALTVLNTKKHTSHMSYTAQIYPFIELRPSKHFFFHINYQVVFIGCITAADRNFILADSDRTINRRGHMLYHGVTSGIQFNF